MKKTAILFIALAFATFAHSPPAAGNTIAKTAKCVENEKFIVLPTIIISGSDFSMISMEMFCQADSPKSSPTLNGNPGNVILCNAPVSGDKPDDAWATFAKTTVLCNDNQSRTINRFNSACARIFCAARIRARDYSMLGYNKRS